MRGEVLTAGRFPRLFILMLCGMAVMACPVLAEVVGGEVTYATSRSVYVQLLGDMTCSAGDTIQAGADAGVMAPAMVKSVSGRKVVLTRVAALNDADAGSTILIDLPERRTDAAGDTAEDKLWGKRRSIPGTGRFAIQYYRYRSLNGGIEYDQPSAYLDLTTGGGSASPLELTLRFRTRIQRELAMTAGRDMTDERTDRLYDLAATYRAERYTVTLGRTRRIGDAGMGGMGGLDGVIGEYRFADGLTGGAFAGTAPELDNFIGDRHESKAGAYMVWTRDGENRIESAVAFIHRREQNGPETGTLYLGQEYRHSRSFRFAGEAVLIVSRGLGDRNADPADKTLQNARIYANWTAARWLRLTWNYAGYLVREYRDLDAPFDPVDTVRYDHAHTLLSRAEVSLPATCTLSGEVLAGTNPSSGDGLLSAALRGRAANILRSGIAAGLSVVQTEQAIGTGRHLLMNLSRSVARLQCSVTGGMTTYERPHKDDMLTQRLRASLYFMPGRTWYGNLQVTRSWGETIIANTFFIEIGTRFGTNGRL